MLTKVTGAFVGSELAKFTGYFMHPTSFERIAESEDLFNNHNVLLASSQTWEKLDVYHVAESQHCSHVSSRL